MAENVHEETINGWEEFLGVTREIDVTDPVGRGYVFRGQARAEWPLIPSLGRHAKREGIDSQRSIDIEKKALKAFFEQAHLFLPARTVPDKDDDLLGWWTLMQHYKVPTRLLDWTESVFVAAYFAIEEHLDVPGAIWVVHAPSVKERMRSMSLNHEIPKNKNEQKRLLEPKAKPNLYFLTRRIHTDRMGAQQTVSGLSDQILADHGKAIVDAKLDKNKFRKLIIPGTMKPEFLVKLRQMNITARTLFPGIDGLGRSVDEMVKIFCWLQGKTPEKGGKELTQTACEGGEKSGL